ncbi:MAG: hypothetical protein AAF514_20435, partial [Verrucomicrobiota bacterium]
RRRGNNNSYGIPLYPPDGEALIYRNFIDGVGTARGIGVGFSEGVHFAYDAQNGRLARLWRGGFIDAKRHWTGRGTGYQPPSGEAVEGDRAGQLLAALPSPEATWPENDFVQLGKSSQYVKGGPSGFQFRGYELDETQRPTFAWSWRGVSVNDRIEPDGSDLKGLVRVLRLTGNPPREGTLFLRLPGKSDGIQVEVTGAGKPVPHEDKGLRVPIDLSKGTAELTVRYLFR